MTAPAQLAYLGPQGTFSELVARRRYGAALEYLPLPTVDEVFDFVAGDAARLGVVPIENSSGGMIHATVDRLARSDNRLRIVEELSLKIHLAFCAKPGTAVARIYSHFAPLHHCDAWMKATYPAAERVVVASTAEAARQAFADPGGAALCTREAGPLHGLDVLVYPVQQDIPTQTQFYCIGHRSLPDGGMEMHKTSLAVTLPNLPGSLLRFLEPFRDHQLNLTRILSRPFPGRPKEYIFLVDVLGAQADAGVRAALAQIQDKHLAADLRILGSFPVAPTVES